MAMRRSEFLRTTGLGIGGFVLGVGLNLGILLGKKPSVVDADEPRYIVLRETIHHTHNLANHDKGIIMAKSRRSGGSERYMAYMFSSDEFRANITGMGMIDDHKKLYSETKPIVVIVEIAET